MYEPNNSLDLPQEPKEPSEPGVPLVLKDHMTWREFADFARAYDPQLAKEDPEASYVRAFEYLQGAAEFIERQACWHTLSVAETAKVCQEMRTSDDYFRLDDSSGVQRLLDYLAEHEDPFKTLERFIAAYDKEKLPSHVLRETSLKRRSPETGQRERMKKVEQSKERIISKAFVDKFIEIRKKRAREADAERKREQRDYPPEGSGAS
jgi:hypothetical protein